MARKVRGKRSLRLEPLERRLCMAASVGWDGPGQGSVELTYHIENTPAGLDQGEVEVALESALDAWGEVADITFTETHLPNQRDSIDFEFTTIDGSGGTLAQAYFPDDVNPARIAGDVQFDIAEAWEVGNGLGSAAFDLVLVAVHEIGHSLGLDHSDAAGSVMVDSVSPNQTFDGLAPADVDAILALYAPADDSTTDPVTEPIAPTPADTSDPGADPDDGGTDRRRPFNPWFRSPNRFPWFRNPRGFNRWGRFGGLASFSVAAASENTTSIQDNDWGPGLDKGRSSFNMGSRLAGRCL